MVIIFVLELIKNFCDGVDFMKQYFIKLFGGYKRKNKKMMWRFDIQLILFIYINVLIYMVLFEVEF